MNYAKVPVRAIRREVYEAVAKIYRARSGDEKHRAVLPGEIRALTGLSTSPDVYNALRWLQRRGLVRRAVTRGWFPGRMPEEGLCWKHGIPLVRQVCIICEGEGVSNDA